MSERVAEFFSIDGLKLAIKVAKIEAITEDDFGCTLITSSDVYRVKATYDEAKAELWPEGEK